MPPASNKRKKQAVGTEQHDSRAKKASGINFKMKCEFAPGVRGHAKEYGDPTCHPCGAMTYIENHYNTCEDCNAVRILMDCWTTELHKQAEERDDGVLESPPQLTMAAIKMICVRGGFELEDIPKQTIPGWTPWEKPMVWNPMVSKMVKATHSFVEAMDLLPEQQKVCALRPKMLWPEGFHLSDDNAAVAPYMLRQSNTYKNAADYVLNMALKDKAITQGYVNSVLENFGIVREDHQLAAEFSEASGIPVGELFRSFQTPVGEPVVQNYPFSPRVLWAKKNKVDVSIPNLLNTRQKLIPTAQNETDNANPIHPSDSGDSG